MSDPTSDILLPERQCAIARSAPGSNKKNLMASGARVSSCYNSNVNVCLLQCLLICVRLYFGKMFYHSNVILHNIEVCRLSIAAIAVCYNVTIYKGVASARRSMLQFPFIAGLFSFMFIYTPCP